MEVKVLDINGKETGRKVQLSDSVFAIEPNKHAVYLDVKQYLANQRQGTHKAKERAEVAGSTRKIKKHFKNPIKSFILNIKFSLLLIVMEKALKKKKINFCRLLQKSKKFPMEEN